MRRFFQKSAIFHHVELSSFSALVFFFFFCSMFWYDSRMHVILACCSRLGGRKEDEAKQEGPSVQVTRMQTSENASDNPKPGVFARLGGATPSAAAAVITSVRNHTFYCCSSCTIHKKSFLYG
jgi:hypothetical protein